MTTNVDPSMWRDTVIRGQQFLLAGHKDVRDGLAIIEIAREEFKRVTLQNATKRK